MFHAIDTGIFIQVVQADSKRVVQIQHNPIWIAQTQGKETAEKIAYHRYKSLLESYLAASLKALVQAPQETEQS